MTNPLDKCCKFDIIVTLSQILRNCVMVARQSLTLFVKVRILVPQPHRRRAVLYELPAVFLLHARRRLFVDNFRLAGGHTLIRTAGKMSTDIKNSRPAFGREIFRRRILAEIFRWVLCRYNRLCSLKSGVRGDPPQSLAPIDSIAEYTLFSGPLFGRKSAPTTLR